MSADSSSVFELKTIQSLLIWPIAEVIVASLWLLLQRRLVIQWRLFAQLVRLSLIPYFALILGQLSPRAMGLSGYDWDSSLTIGSILIVAIVAVWVSIRVSEEATTNSLENETPVEQVVARSHWAGNGLQFLLAGGWELNWSFWRVVFTELVVLLVAEVQSPIYWGIILAVVLALLLIFLTYSSSVDRITNGAILIATSVLFLFTRNFWLCWLLHGILQLTALPNVNFHQREA